MRWAQVTVHNHGPEEGAGLSCKELRLSDGSLKGACLMVELSKTGLVSKVDLNDRVTGDKIGSGSVERTGSGHIIIHVNGSEVPGCIEDGFAIGDIKIAEDPQGL